MKAGGQNFSEGRLLLYDLIPPLRRRTSELPLEIPAEVRVIGKTASQGNLLNWKSLVCQEISGFIHADLKKICMGSALEKFLIIGIKLAFFQIDCRTKLLGIPIYGIVGEHFKAKPAKRRI